MDRFHARAFSPRAAGSPLTDPSPSVTFVDEPSPAKAWSRRARNSSHGGSPGVKSRVFPIFGKPLPVPDAFLLEQVENQIANRRAPSGDFHPKLPMLRFRHINRCPHAPCLSWRSAGVRRRLRRPRRTAPLRWRQLCSGHAMTVGHTRSVAQVYRAGYTPPEILPGGSPLPQIATDVWTFRRSNVQSSGRSDVLTFRSLASAAVVTSLSSFRSRAQWIRSAVNTSRST